MLLLMFSLAGIPPTVGFYAKLSVLQAVLGRDTCGSRWSPCCLRWWDVLLYSHRQAHVFRRTAGYGADRCEARRERPPVGERLAVLVLGVLPQPLMQLCFYAIKGL